MSYSSIQDEQSRSDPETKIRCSVPTKTARSTANSKARCRSSSPSTTAMPSRSHSRPNSNGPPMRLAATDNDPSASSSSALMSNTWSVSLAPEANSEARAPEAIRSSARPRLAYGSVDASVLDHLNVGARAGSFDAEEHGGSQNRAPRQQTRAKHSSP